MLRNRRTPTLLAALVLTVGGLTAEAATRPAAARATPPAATPSVLVLSVQPATAGPRASVLLCDPADGTHPRAADACATLARVRGDLTALAVDPGPCTLEYAPVTARAWGRWQGRPVSYTETFGNRCELLRETGAVFAF